jgi:hypothetical protein
MNQKNTTLDDLSALIGFSATVKLAAWFGGISLWIPDVVEEGQVLVRLVGMSSAAKLTQEWGCSFVYMPPLNAYEDEVQRRQIGRMLEKGFGSKEIARHNRLSERRVQQLARELEQQGLIEIVVPRKLGRPSNKNAVGKEGGLPGKTLQEKAPSKGKEARWDFPPRLGSVTKTTE